MKLQVKACAFEHPCNVARCLTRRCDGPGHIECALRDTTAHPLNRSVSGNDIMRKVPAILLLAICSDVFGAEVTSLLAAEPTLTHFFAEAALAKAHVELPGEDPCNP